MCLVDVKAVEAVKINGNISPLNQQMLPFILRFDARARDRALDDNNPRPARIGTPARQYTFLESLDIDLEPVHVPIGRKIEHGRQANARHRELARLESAMSVLKGNVTICGRNARSRNLVER